jgi:hypothetical protein
MLNNEIYIIIYYIKLYLVFISISIIIYIINNNIILIILTFITLLNLCISSSLFISKLLYIIINIIIGYKINIL